MIKEKIQQLKKEKNAIILAHNYQLPEIQDIADVTGDSLELSRIAAKADADIIVFCGVRFMAETAKILSPRTKVLLPEKEAGCFLADTITLDELMQLKKEHPSAVFIAYVNSYADIKANVDICCTSANAVNIVRGIPEDKEIVFLPDRNLARYAAKQTGRKNIIPWGKGYCDVHELISRDDIINKKTQYPEAKVIAHPECKEEVLDISDFVASTSGMLKIAKEEPYKQYIIATEKEMVYKLEKEIPGKEFIPVLEKAICKTMKLITLESLLACLEKEQQEIILPDDIIEQAQNSLNRMIEIGAVK